MIIYYTYEGNATDSHIALLNRKLNKNVELGKLKRLRSGVVEVKEGHIEEIIKLLRRYRAIPLKPIGDF